MAAIHTLDARDHMLLGLFRDYFKFTPSQIRREIQVLHTATIDVLAKKGVDYACLRSGLVPVLNRHEAAFIFDSTAIKSSWYGFEVARQVLPLLEPTSTQSVLYGDLLGKDQMFIYKVLSDSLVMARPLNFKHGTLLFAFYLNNLSELTLKSIHDSLASYPGYIGHIPTTYGSRAKTYLSTCLGNLCLKVKKQVILRHEDDRSNDENVNLSSYPFEQFGYKVVSLQESMMGLFLSFKIERPVFDGFEDDSHFALNSISDDVLSLRECKVLIEPAKHGYLLTMKEGKLRQAQIDEFDRDELERIVEKKLMANYVYNMDFLEDHDVKKFSLMIEIERDRGHPTRLAAAFEYIPDKRTLRLITLY